MVCLIIHKQYNTILFKETLSEGHEEEIETYIDISNSWMRNYISKDINYFPNIEENFAKEE